MAEINKLSSTLASPRPTVKIRIVLAGDAVHGPGHVPVKQGGQEIAGFVEVVIRPEMDIDVDLAFEGCVRTWMRAPSNTPDQKQLPHSVAESKFLEQVQTLQTATDAARGQDDLRTVHLPFHFVVPRRLIAAHDNLPGAFLGLSPTACLGPTYTCPYTGKLYAQPSITYSVRVRQLRGHEACFMDASSCLAREVKMIPANDPLPPPTYESIASHRLHASASLLRQCRLGLSPFCGIPIFVPTGTLTVSAAEPAPLAIACSTRSSTTAHLELVFTPCVPRTLHVPPSPTWSVSVTHSVCSRTLVTTRSWESEPALQTATKKQREKKETFMQSKEHTYRSHTQIYRGDALHWQWVAINDSNPPGWKATLPTCVILPTSTLLPSFLNQLSARRYSVRLRIQVVGMRHSTIQLPLQIVHKTMETDTDSSFASPTSLVQEVQEGQLFTDPPPY